eukprot:Blabericola_migrator_1__7072@NODE_3587_length_1658_cov_33_380893_g2227_i0_p3_GENE_NODE_3587_length_1658_cov_33_380893_g2227_i0NODE_3587_length_1658_cov_33_380893_g2227_i0_p3_ORF_typecomplete_len101_score11_28_NODE_3587_length_1658_cov_33_380893_g2227_i012791581
MCCEDVLFQQTVPMLADETYRWTSAPQKGGHNGEQYGTHVQQAYVDRAHLQTRNCTYSDIQDPEPNTYSALQAVEAASHSSVEQQLYKELTLHLGRSEMS